jgi:hypothetical protein
VLHLVTYYGGGEIRFTNDKIGGIIIIQPLSEFIVLRPCYKCGTWKPYAPGAKTDSKASGFISSMCHPCYLRYQNNRNNGVVIRYTQAKKDYLAWFKREVESVLGYGAGDAKYAHALQLALCDPVWEAKLRSLGWRPER